MNTCKCLNKSPCRAGECRVDGSAIAFERILQESNPMGFYQKRLFLGCSFIQIFCASVLMYNHLALRELQYDCVYDNGKVTEMKNYSSNVSISTTCHSDVFLNELSNFLGDIKLEITDKITASEMVSHLQSVCIIVGSLVIAALADSFGRKRVLFLSLLGLIAVQGVTFIANTPFTFLACRGVSGMLAGGVWVVATVFPAESVGGTWRDFCLLSSLWTLGPMLSSLEYRITQNWKYLSLAVTAPGIPLLGICFLVHESPRWMIAKHRFKTSEFILRDIISCNSTVVLDMVSLCDWVRISVVHRSAVRRHWFLDLFHSLQMSKWTALSCFISFICSSVYWCLMGMMQRITGNEYIDNFLPYIIDIPVVLTALVINKCIGRRWCLFLYAMASGISLMLVLILHVTKNLEEIPGMKRGVAILGKHGVYSSMVLVSLIIIEMYPTVIRCMGLAVGMCSFVLGSFTSKFIFLVSKFQTVAPLVFCGILMMLVGILSLLLPETFQRPMPNILPSRHRKIHSNEDNSLMNAWDKL